VSSGYITELISRGRLQTYEISYNYPAKDHRRKKRIVLNTVFEHPITVSERWLPLQPAAGVGKTGAH